MTHPAPSRPATNPRATNPRATNPRSAGPAFAGRLRALGLAVALGLGLAGCGAFHPGHDHAGHAHDADHAGMAAPCRDCQPPAVYAYSTIDALLAGTYDGELSIGELLGKGDFGLGTFNRLDGELVVLDGRAYHVHSDDTVEIAPASDRTPLAYVVPFRPTASLPLEGIASLTELETLLDAKLGNLNHFQAVRIDGRFSAATARAIAPQTRPYKPLAELVKTQSVFRFENVEGTLVGLRSPAFTKGVSVPGWHWHLLTADRKRGGHLLTLRIDRAEARMAPVDRLEVQLPGTDDFARADQSRDRKDELKKVEGER
ncbi:acetolactate decarboxylase [Derxia gummosa]|uniref:Alpha-acetolactate decarboxylase n=1 Tax=Derxia gummosa DSM 723 TaxID=1121388 RepID=A0A8B6XAA6_9BURK|nr:acetolactate decarboxylase [Derxia gummosa]